MAQLAKRKKVENLEQELIQAKNTLEQAELKALILKQQLEDDYQLKFTEMFKFIKKKKTDKEYRALKNEFDLKAKPELRQAANKAKVLTKRYCTLAEKSVSGLVRVCETTSQDVEECVEQFKAVRRTFRFSAANPNKMFSAIIEYEKLRARLTGIVLVLQTASKCQEQHLKKYQRNKYFNENNIEK